MEKLNLNGRVNVFDVPKTCDLFNLYEKTPVKECATYRNATQGIWTETLLSKAYFSEENIQIIQNGIRKGVYDRSNQQYVIAPQNCDDIKMVMRSIFLQHSKNLNTNISQQIYELNQLVIAYCVNKIYSEGLGYMNYIRDVSTLVVPIQHPVLSNMKDKELEFKSWF